MTETRSDPEGTPTPRADDLTRTPVTAGTADGEQQDVEGSADGGSQPPGED